MSGGVEEVTGDRVIGDPITIRTNLLSDAPRYYGRFLRFDGDEYRGSRPTVIIVTPGGSTVRGGLFYVSRIDSPEELERLDYWEKEAMSRGVFYGGKIMKTPGGWIETPRD